MKIAVIGSGKVASWLINALAKTKYKITAIYSRNEKTAKTLSKKFDIPINNSINEIDAELIFICVNDDSIPHIASELKGKKATIVHTSGTVSMDTLQRANGAGVLWPLQTLTSKVGEEIAVPLFVTASDAKTKALIQKIGKSISNKVYVVDEEERKKLHLAAVMTNNFINHLVTESKYYLENNNLSYEMLVPILKQTFSNLTIKPYNFTQTGPAARGDKKTISSHKRLLKEYSPELLKMYTVISESIFKKHNS